MEEGRGEETMGEEKGTQLCCVRVRFSFRVDLRVRDRVCMVEDSMG